MPFLVPFIPAIIGATATVAAGAIAAGAANHSVDAGLAAQNHSTDAGLAAQQAALDRITGIQQPFIAAGQGALGPLAARVGAGAPNFSSPAYAAPQQSAYAVPPGQPPNVGDPVYRDHATGVPDGSLGTGKTGNGVSIDPSSVGPSGVKADPGPAISSPQAAQAAGPDWDAYIAANPDVAAWIQQGHGDPNLGPSQTPEQAAAYQYQNTGQSEGRQLPTMAPNAGATTPQAPAQPLDLGTASPVVANYFRPDQGTAPSASSYVDPSKFTTSPDYLFRLNQGERDTNAKFGAKGLLQSGAALQGFNDYAQGAASQEYGNWFNRGMQLYGADASRFNSDRANTNNNYTDDRSYGTNLAINNRDFANSQYNTQTQNMFQLAGVGANAANAVSGAVTNNANNSTNLFTAQGNNAANAAYANGQTTAGLAGTIGSTVGNIFGGTARSGASQFGTPGSYAIPASTYTSSTPFSGPW